MTASSNTSNKPGRGSRIIVLMMIISCLAQVLNIAKTSLIGGIFGASSELDAFNFANSITTFTFGILASGISTIVIPCYVQKDKRRSLDAFITAIYAVQLLIILLLGALRFDLVALFSGKQGAFVQTTGSILTLLLTANYIASFANLATAYLQANNRYIVPQLISFAAQLATVLLLLFLPDMDIRLYALIIAAGLALNAVGGLCVALGHGWRFRPRLLRGDAGAGELIHRFLPTIFSSGVYQLSLMVDSTIASRLDVGKVTILSYSSQIASVVNAILVGNLLAYLFPKIVANIQSSDSQRKFWRQSVLMHSIICLVIAGFIAIGREGVSLLFEHGRFDAQTARYVFLGAAIYIIGQQTNVVRDLIYRYFYARGNTAVTARNSVLVSVVNIAVSLVLVRLIGFFGIILGTVIASLVSLIRIMFIFRKTVGADPSMGRAIFSYLRNLAMAAVTAAIVLLSKRLLPEMSDIPAILIFGVETVVLYLGQVALFDRGQIRTLREL